MDFGALKRSIRFKMLGGILILELLMVAVFSGVLLVSARKDLALNATKAVERSQGAYNLILQGDAKMLAAAMDCFATNAAVRQIYAEHQDRQKLLDAVQDAYRINKTRYGITHLYFIDKDGTCFLRAHDTGNFGDQIQRDTFLQSRAAGKTISGIELGKTAFALRVVTPYLHGGNLIGFLEFGEEIDHFDQLVKRETGVDVAVMVDKRFLDEEQYHKTMKASGKPDTWNQFKGFVMVSTTLPDAKTAAALVSEDDFRKTAAPEYFGTLDRGGASLAKGAFPLKDSSGKQVGVVLTLNDVTDQVRNERMALWTLVLITLLVFAGSFLVGAAYLRAEIVGPLVRLAGQAKEISMGNVELKLETEREDEIGLLIRAFERMRVSLKKSMAMLSRND
ncbi:cache domain-containing protein [Geothrix terrae]|uniref:cache domain-containing protein n=1 Tax=Geothrix terrae TaxID=2922720 RepID=UPI001FAD113F|nr:cache domain-containing protein [Geothrix terrae]